MQNISARADACKTREFLLVAVRCARFRVQLLKCELDEIGVALKFNMITPEVAVEWLHHMDALCFVNSDAWCEQVPE